MGPKQADAFMRLYMLPGVQHCGGGPGPNHYGDFDAGAGCDASFSTMLLALERWVESGVAPADLTAVRYKAQSRRGCWGGAEQADLRVSAGGEIQGIRGVLDEGGEF